MIPCAVCGNDSDDGYVDDTVTGQLPVCDECYDTGKLDLWLAKRDNPNLFFGKFTVSGVEIEVLPEDYSDLPDDLPPDMIISAAKQMAVARTSKQSPPSGKVDLIMRSEENFNNGPIARFIGKLVIFDGNNLAHRCRHSFNLSNGDVDTSVTYGVIRIIASTLQSMTDVKSCVVCWDGGTPPHRLAASPEYKATRHHDEDVGFEDFIRQIKLLHDILPSFGIASLRKIKCEADDLMAAIAAQVHGDVQGIIITSDHDLYQCVDYHVAIQNPNKPDLLTVDNFQQEVGVACKDFLTYKSLIGDGSDNLDGVKGIGPKTAVKLIDDYHSPSNMLNIANGIGDLNQYPAMSPSVALKLSNFGLEGFKRMFTTVRLDKDLCGARQYVRIELTHNWEPYNPLKAVGFLKSNAFISLMEPAIYQVFKGLGHPRLCLNPILDDIRMPKPIVARKPVEVAA